MSDVRDSGEFASPPPRRWLDDKGGATDAERSLLRNGVNVDPPADADRKVWMALVAKIGPIGGGAGGGGAGAPGTGAATAAKGATSAASAAAASGGIVTSALIGAACAVAVLVGSSALENRRPEPAPKPVAQTIAPAPRPIEAATPLPAQAIATQAPSVAVSPDAPEARVAPSAAPSNPKPNDTASPRSPDAPAALDPGAPRGGEFAAPTDPGGSGVGALDPGGALGSGDAASRLREESQILGQAREALHGGDVARCFGLLETARTRFPSGGLGQEREALTIEALARSGNRALAAERANAFLAAHPTSPHAARVRTFAQQ